MSLKRRVWTILDITLRVPPVFVMDAALNYGLGPPHTGNGRRSEEYVLHNNSSETVDILSYGLQKLATTFEGIALSFFWIFVYIQVFFIALFVFLLTTKQLVSIYIRLSSLAIIVLAYRLNVDHVNVVISNGWHQTPSFGMQRLTQFTFNYFLQMILAVSFCFTNTIANIPRSIMWLLFLAPTVFSAFSLPSALLKAVPLISATGSFLLLLYSMWTHGMRVCETVYKGVTWCHNIVENYGLYTMLETHWLSLHIPQVFRVFWLIRLGEHLMGYLSTTDHISCSFYEVFKDLIIKGSENIVALLGMTSIVAYLSQGFGYTMQAFLLIDETEDKSIGNVSALLFFILAVQTGVTGLEPEKRFIRIYRNFCLLFTALLHFVHNILNPILLSLSASRNPSVGKHIRALLVSAFLMATPICLLIHQWHTQPTTTWLLAVTSFMVELIIKSTTSFLIYVLFMIDAYRNGLWEKLDDYVYYLKATSSCVEFIFGIFLLGNGIWIFVFESSGAIRACMMCLHAYFNIWVQAKKGWESFLLRRTSLHKIDALPEATVEQLRERNDVCAICFQDLNSARITRCNHYFHGVCLRKWLNVQDKCPLCHTSLCDKKTPEQNPWNELQDRLEARINR